MILMGRTSFWERKSEKGMEVTGQVSLRVLMENRKSKGPEACFGYRHGYTSIPPAPANRPPTTFLSMR